MKKVLFMAVALLTATMASADVEVKSGTMKALQDPNARILVTWDYSKMLIEKKTPEEFLKEKGAEWQRDYPAEVAGGEANFTVWYNKKCKKFAQVTDMEADAGYELIIHIDAFNYGSTAAAVMFGGFARGASMQGTIEVKDLKTNETICTLEMDSAGKSAWTNEARRALLMMDVAEDLAKAIKKAK